MKWKLNVNKEWLKGGNTQKNLGILLSNNPMQVSPVHGSRGLSQKFIEVGKFSKVLFVVARTRGKGKTMPDQAQNEKKIYLPCMTRRGKCHGRNIIFNDLHLCSPCCFRPPGRQNMPCLGFKMELLSEKIVKSHIKFKCQDIVETS